jgi:hypothetical protein
MKLDKVSTYLDFCIFTSIFSLRSIALENKNVIGV